MREDQAREKGIPIASGVFPMMALGKARAYGDTEGFVKVVRNRETQEIVGVHALGHAATEFIAAAAVLVHTKAKATDVADMIFAHPTMSEAVREAAEMSLFEGLHQPPAKAVRVRV
jgi:dihydrolipoamide dehydrogenase